MGLLTAGVIGAGLLGSTVSGAIGNRRQQEAQGRASVAQREQYLEDRAHYRQQFEADRLHSEGREDTALTRRMQEAQGLGIHPLSMVGGAGAGAHIQPGMATQGQARAEENNWQFMAEQLGSVAQMGLLLALSNNRAARRKVNGGK